MIITAYFKEFIILDQVEEKSGWKLSKKLNLLNFACQNIGLK
jgi:hypothetical protein